MTPDAMDDLEIRLAVAKECELRMVAQADPNADPSLFVPWGIMRYDPDRAHLRTSRPD